MVFSLEAATRVEFFFYLLTFLLTSYLLLTMVLRAMLGEKVYARADFWFYLSSWSLVTSFTASYIQQDAACSFVCYTYWPIHASSTLGLIYVMKSRLETHNLQRLFDIRKDFFQNSFKRTVTSLIWIYAISAVIKTFTRFFDECYAFGQIGGCVVGIEPVYFLGNVENLVATLIECILCYLYTRMMLSMKFEMNFPSFQWQIDMSQTIYRTAISSITICVTNILFYIYCAIAHTMGKRLGREHPASWNMYQIYLGWSSANMLLTVIMVAISMPSCNYDLRQFWFIWSRHSTHFLKMLTNREDIDLDLFHSKRQLTDKELAFWGDFEKGDRKLPPCWREINGLAVPEETSSEFTEGSSSYGAPLVYNEKTGEVEMAYDSSTTMVDGYITRSNDRDETPERTNESPYCRMRFEAESQSQLSSNVTIESGIQAPYSGIAVE